MPVLPARPAPLPLQRAETPAATPEDKGDAGSAATPPGVPALAGNTPATAPTAPAVPGVTSAVSAGRQTARTLAAPPALTAPGEPSLEVEADRVDGVVDQVITATGQAYVRKGWDELFGDVLRWNMATQEASGEGNIVKRDQDSEITGTRLTYNQGSGTGKVDDATFSIVSMDGKGRAGSLNLKGPGRYSVQDKVDYTTCDFNDPDWLLKADSVDIDENTNEGLARNARILAGGKVPVFYSPRLQFALSAQRKSGFLTPSVSVTSRTGVQVFAPYYWNIAPNMDATITPRYMAKRGLQIGGELRYLEESFAGRARAEFMPSDDVTGKQRWALSLIHLHSIDDRTSAYVNYETVSDDAYFRDLTNRLGNAGSLGSLGSGFAAMSLMRSGSGILAGGSGGGGGGILGGTATRLLPQAAGINYSGDGWDLLARVRSFQVLQDPSKPITQPYQALPNVHFTGSRLLAGLADTRLDADFSSFSLRYLPQVGEQIRPEGERFILNPSVGLPIRSLWGYIEPRASLHTSYYTLDPAGSAQTTLSRSVPTFSVDSGLLFERRLTEAGSLQTFEPRIFYAYTPYRDQRDFPVFDTGRYDFNFAEIFSANRFVGQDRIGDANQVTAGATTRFINEKGVERLKVTLAQRYTLQDLKVGLNDTYLTTDTPKRGVSDILGEFSGRIVDSTSLITRVQYSPETSDVQKGLVALRYNPELGKVINLGYRYTREVSATQLGLQQVDLSAQWPISGNLYGLARTNYSLIENRQTEGLLGLEYYGSCWSVRAVVQNLALTANTSTRALFILLELKGIAGTDPADYNMILSRNIGGYSKVDYDQNRTTEALFQ
jgi:LPS-assembly protein